MKNYKLIFNRYKYSHLCALIYLIFCFPLYGETDIKAQPEVESEIEQHRSQAEEQAQKSLIKEAADAIEETEKAANAIAKGEHDVAIAALERANGKLSILVARHPEKALLPVDYRIRIINSAPPKIKEIKNISLAAAREVEKKHFPEARVLLDILRSEINVRTYHLPLATYPLALQEAAHLLEQKKLNDAYSVLRIALDTLVIVNHVIPLPLLNARALLAAAEENHEKDKGAALDFVGKARYEIERAKELCYAGKDETYSALHKAINNLERDLRSNRNAASSFAALKDKVKGFLQHFSETKTQSH